MQRVTKSLIAATIGLVVASCGAGGGQTAGIDRGGIVSGPVTGYGSIWVNGERYATDAATIFVNGAEADESDLAVGQVVVLDSLISGTSLSAERIVYESNLKGPIQSVDAFAGTFMALGQQVIIDTSTSFGPGIVPVDITGLAPNDIVEVSGLVDTAGRIRATRIEKEDAPDEVQLTGVVSALVNGISFNIGAQVVDYSNATMIDGFSPAGIIVNGDRVRVIGSGFINSGELPAIIATTVANRGLLAVTDDGEDGDIEGLITDFSSPSSFRLAGFSVLTNGQTEYSGGTEIDLDNDIRIEAEGRFDPTGILVADKIEFREEGESRIEATVDSKDAANNTVTVFGIKVATTPLTRIEDKRDEIRPFGIGNLEPGDFLKVEGSWDGAKVVATRLERLEGEDKYKLRGLLTSVSEPQFNVLGLNVVTDASTNFEADATAFFAAAVACVPECLVEVAWPASGPYQIAGDVELDD